MTDQSWKIYKVLCITVSIVTLVINFRWTAGWLLGSLVTVLLYKRIESFWNGILDTGYADKKTGRGNYFTNYLIMAAALLICALLPDYLNIFACALGLMAVKFTSVIEVLITGRGKS